MSVSSSRYLCLTALVLGAAAGCRRAPAVEQTAVVPFRDMFAAPQTLALASEHPLASVPRAVVSDSEVWLIDARAADLKVFSRTDGSLRRVLGRPGDGRGEFRRPIEIVAMDSGRVASFDLGRGVVSLRRADGDVIAETPSIIGFFNGLVALPEEGRFLLSGPMRKQVGAAKNTDLHEIDASGRVLASYGHTVAVHSDWESRYATLFAARIGDLVISGSMNSNRLRLIDRRTKSERWMDVAPGWYRQPEWPSDRLIAGNVDRNTVARRLTEWSSKQRLMNGVFPLDGGRFLVRFIAHAAPGALAFSYALCDTTGRTYAVSQATWARVVATRGDTAFWMSGSASHPVLGASPVNAGGMLARRAVGPARLAAR